MKEVKTVINKRPPIVTIMGHVDHGKTSILDVIRTSHLQEKEAGGITQSIGAYQVYYNDKPITFIDTPGHYAFAQMRARGGLLADIVVLVVAADDGVMPQTIEALSHAKASGAKLIVAINKVDLPGANINKIKQQLADKAVDLEEYGGSVKIIETSATKKTGINLLLEAILEESAALDLGKPVTAEPELVIIESFLDDRKGVVAHGIVRNGILSIRDIIAGGTTSARIKSLTNWQGEAMKSADSGTPVEVLGFNDIPDVGVSYIRVDKPKDAEKIVDRNKRESADGMKFITPQERILQQIRDKEIKEIPIVIKAESTGSLEVIVKEVQKINTEEVRFKVIHDGIGNINENDVLLAVPVRGIVIGFNVDVDSKAEAIARRERIIYRLYEIIYELLDELSDVVAGEIEALTVQVLGEARVKEVFVLSDKSLIAGSEVFTGRIRKGNKALLERNHEVIAETRVTSLKFHKDDVNEVTSGNECGIKLGKGVEPQLSDIIKVVSE